LVYIKWDISQWRLGLYSGISASGGLVYNWDICQCGLVYIWCDVSGGLVYIVEHMPVAAWFICSGI
jgi:hypothetical protein